MIAWVRRVFIHAKIRSHGIQIRKDDNIPWPSFLSIASLVSIHTLQSTDIKQLFLTLACWYVFHYSGSA